MDVVVVGSNTDNDNESDVDDEFNSRILDPRVTRIPNYVQENDVGPIFLNQNVDIGIVRAFRGDTRNIPSILRQILAQVS